MNDVYDIFATLRRERQEFAMCTVVSVKGSAPREAGAKMIVKADGSITGTIGGGAVEKRVIADALVVLKSGLPKIFRHDLLHQHSMCCGGTMEIFIEPVMRSNLLYIFGAGHTGVALAKYASELDFEIFLIDDRRSFLDACSIPGVNKMNLPYQAALQALRFDAQSYVCIMTYSHDSDREILAYCMKKPHAYLGMIGSERKCAVTRKMFVEAGVGIAETLDSIDMPMGLDIGAEGPEEIALSVLAKLIEVKRKPRTI